MVQGGQRASMFVASYICMLVNCSSIRDSLQTVDTCYSMIIRASIVVCFVGVCIVAAQCIGLLHIIYLSWCIQLHLHLYIYHLEINE